MKKILSMLLVCVLLVGTLFALTSCGGPSGKYQDALKVTTLEFSGSKVTITIDNIIGNDTVLEGKYDITEDDEGNKTITFTFESEDDEADAWDAPMSYSEGEEDGKQYIKIGIVKYTKAD